VEEEKVEETKVHNHRDLSYNVERAPLSLPPQFSK